MHYFKRNIGDYHKKAGRLTMLQHGAYTLLLDACYDRERFPTEDEAIDWCWASTPEEEAAVKFVLRRFFECIDDVFVQHRIQEEIEAYQERSAKNKQIAIERETKRREKSTKRAQAVHDSSPDENETPPNHKPLTINHKPKEKHTSDSDESNKRFEEFWKLYPRKDNRKKAETAFKRLSKTKQCQAIADVEKRYTGVERRFIPIPTTYLNGERWNDEVKPSELIESKPEWSILPRSDEDLWNFAKKHGFSNPGQQTYMQYRRTLQVEIERRHAKASLME